MIRTEPNRESSVPVSMSKLWNSKMNKSNFKLRNSTISDECDTGSVTGGLHSARPVADRNVLNGLWELWKKFWYFFTLNKSHSMAAPYRPAANPISCCSSSASAFIWRCVVSSLCGHARNFEENFVPLLVRPFTKSKPNRPFRSRTWNLYNFPLPASTYLNATTLSSHQSKRRCHIWKKYADSQPCGTWRTNFIQSATWHLATAGGSQFIRLLQLGPTGWASRQSNGRLTFADGQ